MNRSRLLNYKGTNGHSRKRGLNHKVKMHLSVYALLTIATLTAIGFGKLHSWQLDQELQFHKVYAVAPTKPYQEPTLNPDLTERENTSALIKRIWGKDAEIGISIATCESGLRPNALNHNSNDTWDQGVFQINTVHQMPEMLNPVANISYAYSMYIQQGLNPWSASKHCWEVSNDK